MTMTHSDRYRSGPLQRTERLGAGIGSFVVRLYWKVDNSGSTVGWPVYWVDFELFKYAGMDSDTGAEVFERPWSGDGGHPGMTSDLDQAEPAAYGHLKWDGCMDLQVVESHFCDLDSLRGLFTAIEQTRRLCAESMPGTDVLLEYPAA